MQVRFYLERNKAVKEKKAIWMYVREKDKGYYLNTGQKIQPSQWDKRTQRANPKKVKDNVAKGSLNSLNQLLNSYENKTFEIIRYIKSKDLNASFDDIVEVLNNYFKKKELTLFDAYDEFLSSKRQMVSQDAIQKYERTKSLLKEFVDKTKFKLTFDNITQSFFDKFYSFLLDGGMINNSAYKTISFFKTFMIWANQRNLTDNISYQHFKSKYEKNEVIYLTEKELMDLYNLNIDEERLERVRDIFIFQCFTGVRYSDIQNLTRADIFGPTWKLRTQKTRDIIEIPLNSYALSVLEKYKKYDAPIPSISNQKFNKYIKEVCEKAKINAPVKIVQYKGSTREETTFKKYEVIGSHTARRTFISLSLQKGMSAEVIMSITGHTTYRMMQRYLKIADSKKRDEMDKVWGSHLTLVKKDKL